MIKAIDVVEFIGDSCEIVGDVDADITDASPIDSARENSLCFCSVQGEDGLRLIKSSRSNVIICSNKDRNFILSSLGRMEKCLIFVENPRLEYAKLLREFFSSEIEPFIHSTAIIDPSAEIGEGVTIGSHTVVGRNCSIGDGCNISSNVCIYENTTIGDKVVVHAGAVIGADGFGFEKDEPADEWIKFPSLGGVNIGKNVEIGANSCIDRGSLSNTYIGEGTKIDNLSHIAHNVSIGRNCIIVANVFLGGRVSVGDNTWIGPESSVLNGLKIGNNVFVGMAAVVIKDLEDGVVVVGNPARVLRANE